MADITDTATAPSRRIAGASLQPRRVGAVNWQGLWTLIVKEVRRFFKVAVQTIFAPAVTSLLFLIVFRFAFGDARGEVNGVAFVQFLAPGLIMLQVINNAFANASSSIIVSKVQGNIVDVLMPPISPLELTVAFVVGAVVRGLVVGVATALAMVAFVDITPMHIVPMIVFATMASILFGALGAIAGIWAEKFDHLAAVTNFIIQPLAFLSGTFYSVTVLPEPFRTISHFNPVFYLIDGFRYGFLGVSDASPWLGLVVTGGLSAALVLACHVLFASGYKLKS